MAGVGEKAGRERKKDREEETEGGRGRKRD